ncbi:TPR-like protein [Athelia psychrophila]|uniref:TPR-like protein n=1 Tax=Athelia psychrophila TaxID=1759441 RepID=A0A166L6M2_9AGAM|nr:TPR-like protein [Fibularhizoctonia sp. CBS 109695]
MTSNTSYTSGGTVNNVNGNIQSQVNNHYQGHPPVASSNLIHPLAPFNDAPVDRISSSFMGRYEDLQAIASTLDSCDENVPSRFAIWGMPGLGKSQVVLEYANSSFKSGRHRYIFWISASTMEKVNQGLAKILDLVHLDRRHLDQAAQLTAARLCLEHSEQYGFQEWLVVFDNVTSSTLQFLREHLPRQNRHGSILITTRTLELANAVTSVAGQQYPVHELKTLSAEQSANLLFRSAGIQSSDAFNMNSAQKLVKRIGCLPLAVEQAGSYMKRNGLSGADQLEVLYDQRGLEEVIVWENSLTTYETKSVLATFIVQLKRLGDIDPNLLLLFKTLAFFDPENIPIDIIVFGAKGVGLHLEKSPVVVPEKKSTLRDWFWLVTKLPWTQIALELPRVDAALAVVPLELRSLLGSIRSESWMRAALCHFEDLSLARPLYGGRKRTSLHVHDLIQQVVLQQNAASLPLGETPCFALATTLLCAAFESTGSPIGSPEQPQFWPEYERLVPHLMSLAKYDITATSDFMDKTAIINTAVTRYLWKRGRYGEAEALATRVLTHRKKSLGLDHPRTLSVMRLLAETYSGQGRYQEAEQLQMSVLKGREDQLGSDHMGTVETVHDLALIYERQGKYTEAEAFYQRALAGVEQHLGADHLNTLLTVHNLAFLYGKQAKYSHAEALFHRALAGQEKQLDIDHPATLLTVHNLAWLHHEQENYNKAEPLYKRAQSGSERQLGADHVETLKILGNIAGLYQDQGKYTEAEKLYNRVLAGQQQQLGEHHIDTLITMRELAILYEKQGTYDEAEALFGQALEGLESQLDDDHPNTLLVVHGLAELRKKQGRYDEAKLLYERALLGNEKQLGADHPQTLKTVNSLAKTWYRKALAGREKQLGAERPSALMTIHGIALVYEKQGKCDPAAIFFGRALAGQERQLGPDHPDTLSTVHDLANFCAQQSRYQAAERLYHRALEGREKSLGLWHPSTLDTIEALALLYESHGRPEDARIVRDKAAKKSS